MKGTTVQKRLLASAMAAGLAALALPAPAAAQATALEPTVLGTYDSGRYAVSAAEIVVHDPATQRLLTVNAQAAVVDVLDIADPAAPRHLFALDAAHALGVDGAAVNSVDVAGDLIAVAVEAPDKTDPGWAVFFDADGEHVADVAVGALPDSLAFTPDGGTVVVANEGEPAEDYSVDPHGTITIVDTATFTARTADFAPWADGERDLPEGFRVFGPDGGADIAANIEPEYVSVADDATAYVTLQENNAIAVVDIAAAEVTDLLALGTKDHAAPGNELDASNEDGAIDIRNWPVHGMYLPDAVDTYTADGRTYLVTANEGDARDWEAYSEEARVADLELCEGAFDGWDDLQAPGNLGRLKVTTSAGRTDAGCYDRLYSYGARSFSIWSSEGELVFDSGADFERRLAADAPEHFNADNESNDFDDRSDDKGPEPEAVAVGAIGERTYAFIGLERHGGVMVYDVTDPSAATVVDYVNNRDFSVEPGDPGAGDLGPESIAFIAADDSPTGRPLIAVGNEVSGTTTVYDLLPGDGDGDDGSGPGDGDGASPQLPVTGTGATGLLLAAAGIALAAGAMLLRVRRRTRTAA